MTDLIIIEKCSYFSEGGLVELEIGLAQLPKETAEYFVGTGLARYPDNVKTDKKG